MILYKIFKDVYSRRILSQDYVHQTIYDPILSCPILRLYSFTSYHRRMIQNLKTFLAITEQDLKHPAFLKQKQDVFYLLLNTKANVFTKDFTRIIHSLLDIVEANQGPTALVTVSLAKLFSGGLDLKYTSGLHEEERRYFIMETITVFGRIAVLPFPTICLVRGGAVAAGCMLAFSHDYVYVSGKAMFSTNQSQNQIPFPPGMMSVIKKRHAYAATARDMILFSKQFVAEKALEGKLIDGIWSQEEAVKKVHDLGSELSSFGDNKVNMRMIKSQLYKQVIEACFGRQLHSYNVVGYNKMAQFAKL